MENFDWTGFVKRIRINTNVETIYTTLASAEGLTKWLLSESEFTSKDGEMIDSKQCAKAGDAYKWRWYAQNHYEEGTVIEGNGVDRFGFTFAGDCKVSIELKKDGNATMVELKQLEIPLDDASKESIRLGCAFGWSFYLTNLKSILEGGIDLRNKDTTLKGVVNN